MKQSLWFAIILLIAGNSYSLDARIPQKTTPVTIHNDLTTLTDYFTLGKEHEALLKEKLKQALVVIRNNIVEHDKNITLPQSSAYPVSVVLNVSDFLPLFEHPGLIKELIPQDSNPALTGIWRFLVGKNKSTGRPEPTALGALLGRFFTVKITFNHQLDPNENEISLLRACVNKIDEWETEQLTIKKDYSPLFAVTFTLMSKLSKSQS